MNFNEQPKFSFLYNGKPFGEVSTKTVEKTGNVTLTKYDFGDGLTVINRMTYYADFDAYEWVNEWEYVGDKPSGLITELKDYDFSVPFDKAGKYVPSAELGYNIDDSMRVYAPEGGGLKGNEFDCEPDLMIDLSYVNHLDLGKTIRYATVNGRSSEKQAPFFHIHEKGKGVVYALGWTGQWAIELTREENAVLFKGGLENISLRMNKGEKWRTASAVVLPYEGDTEYGQNKWRRLVREHFSLIGKEGRDALAPITLNVWGGMNTDSCIKRIRHAEEVGLKYDYLWMDAGWYGDSAEPCPDEFTGDWYRHVGDWRINPNYHPDGLRDVAKAVHESGHKFLLWFEPERAFHNTPSYKEHPEYFIDAPDYTADQSLLNLGNEQALKYCVDTVSGIIESVGIDCYRQDFNIEALPFFKAGDSEDRHGVTEIKHINGLYKFWDTLLERFPHLIIDNCASGGRRIDIETLRRSIPLWRSDLQCPVSCLPEFTQQHQLCYNYWLPYSGTTVGKANNPKDDKYTARGAYSPANCCGYFYSEASDYGKEEQYTEARETLLECYSVRPYFSGDMYKLTESSHDLTTWSAIELNREDDGLIIAIRRVKSPYRTSSFKLKGLDESANYTVTNKDTGEEKTLSGKSMAEGFEVTLDKPRSSCIIFYKKKK